MEVTAKSNAIKHALANDSSQPKDLLTLKKQLSLHVVKVIRKGALTEEMLDNVNRKLAAANTKSQPQPAGNKLHYSHHVVSD